MNLLFSEQCLNIKMVLIEAIGDVIKYFDEDVQDLFVNDDGSILDPE